jgi:hypothetical protein
VFYGDTTAVQLAASTRVGQVTPVRFTGFAGGCVRQDTTEAEVAGLEAEVRPYKREPTRLPRNRACTAELRLDQNVAQVRFVEPGRARVRIVGLARPGDTRLCSSEIWRSCLNWEGRAVAVYPAKRRRQTRAGARLRPHPGSARA